MVAPAARIEIIWDSAGTLWAMNVMHARLTGPANPISQATADQVNSNLSVAFTEERAVGEGTMQQSIANGNRLHSCRVTDLSFVNATTFSSEVLLTGLGGATELPDPVSLPVEFLVGPGARNGRAFQWGYSIGANGGTGRPILQAIDRTVHFWSRVVDQMPTATGLENAAVLRRPTLTNPAPASTADIIGVRRSPAMVAAGWSTQRRRRDGLELIV